MKELLKRFNKLITKITEQVDEGFTDKLTEEEVDKLYEGVVNMEYIYDKLYDKVFVPSKIDTGTKTAKSD